MSSESSDSNRPIGRMHAEADAAVDPTVVEAVHSVRDRFGAAGLRDMLALARVELDVAEQALRELGGQDVNRR